MSEKNGDEALAQEGANLSRDANTTSWGWAQWAYDIAPIGEDQKKNGAGKRLESIRELTLDHETAISCEVPKASSLRIYRFGAAATLPEHREYVSVKAGIALYKAEPFEREQIIGILLDEGVPITAPAVKETLTELRSQRDAEDEDDDNEDDTDEKEEEEPEFPSITLAQWKLMSERTQRAVLTTDGGKSFNKQSNTHIGWAAWSWNPITGCLHGCKYCYAREIANRFYVDEVDSDDPFIPALRPTRLTAPQHTSVPRKGGHMRRVFCGSMTDNFGKWVPEEWIKTIFEQIKMSPQFEYLMLTKFPQRLAKFEWPDNVWAGTTVDTQARVKNAQRSFEKVTAGVKWLSCEPLLEPLHFDSLEMFDWVVIGSQTATSQPDDYEEEVPADIEAVMDLYWQARQAGCKVYMKDNLLGKTSSSSPGMKLIQEWPR